MKPCLHRFQPPMIRAAVVLIAAVVALDAHAADAARGKRAASAAGSPKAHVEVFASLLFDDEFSEEHLGLRGSYFLTDRFALEGSLSRFDVGRNLDFFIADFSAKYYLRPQSRAPLYFVGGPGKAFEDIGDLGDGPLLLHLGFGAEVSLGRQLYLRPELRVRWVEDHFDTSGGDLSLGFGWSF